MSKVGIIMGRDSDWKVMQEAKLLLDEAGVLSDVLVASAHRTPEDVAAWAKGAEEKGYKVIIAGAGKAAHLPGVVAAYTVLPVIGVPVGGSDLAGADALYAIVQMPPGIPVATVAINGAKNAAILAVEIIAVADEKLRQWLKNYRLKIAGEVRNKNACLQNEINTGK